MQPILSVIVPVYKVEEYIDECVRSILGQSLFDIEVILVDDGSPDNCGQICDHYKIKDNRVKVIHKKNGGLSEARNVGIENSLGKYIAFVDSDDYVTSFGFKELTDFAEEFNLDIVKGRVYLIKNGQILEKNKKQITFYNEIMDGEFFLAKSITSEIYEQGVWSCIYKSELIKSNNLYFKTNLLHEDTLWTPQIYLKARRIAALNKFIYFYRVRNDSITSKKDKTKNGQDIISSCYELAEVFSKIDNVKHRDIFYNRLCETYFNGVYYLTQSTRKEYPVIDLKFPIGKAKSIRNIIKGTILQLGVVPYKTIIGFFKNIRLFS